MSSDVEAEVRCHRILQNPGGEATAWYYTQCATRGLCPKWCIFVFVCHFWSTSGLNSETISSQDYGTTDQAGLFSHKQRLGALQIRCWWRSPSLCFCQASARLQHQLPKIER